MKFFEQLWTHILDILFPKSHTQLFLESLTAKWLLENIPPPDDNIPPFRAVLSYRHPVARQMIWLLKYRGNEIIARTLAEVLFEYILEEISDNMHFSGTEKFILVPVPLSKKRLRERGFNQSELLCRELVNLQPDIFEMRLDILIKNKDTASQSKTISKTERQKNLSGAFFCNENLKDNTILVIDDVFTTGSTFLEIGKTLKKQNPKEVLFFAVGH